MRDGLNATGRPVYFSLCSVYIEDATIGNSWRIANDINTWENVLPHMHDQHFHQKQPGGPFVGQMTEVPRPSCVKVINAMNCNAGLRDRAGPGGWNDADMLLGSTPGAAAALTPARSRTQFS